MSKKPLPKSDNPEQSKRFIEAAREAEADETEEGAKRAFDKVVREGIRHPPSTGSDRTRAKP
jgi:hypothetical protein